MVVLINSFLVKSKHKVKNEDEIEDREYACFFLEIVALRKVFGARASALYFGVD